MSTDPHSREEGREAFISAMDSYGAFFLDGDSGNYHPVEELEGEESRSIRAIIDYRGDVEIPEQNPDHKYEEQMGEADITGRLDSKYDPDDTSLIEMKVIYPWHYRQEEIEPIVEGVEIGPEIQVEVEGDVEAKFLGSPRGYDPEEVADTAGLMVENGQEIIDRLARESVRKFFD